MRRVLVSVFAMGVIAITPAFSADEPGDERPASEDNHAIFEVSGKRPPANQAGILEKKYRELIAFARVQTGTSSDQKSDDKTTPKEFVQALWPDFFLLEEEKDQKKAAPIKKADDKREIDLIYADIAKKLGRKGREALMAKNPEKPEAEERTRALKVTGWCALYEAAAEYADCARRYGAKVDKLLAAIQAGNRISLAAGAPPTKSETERRPIAGGAATKQQQEANPGPGQPGDPGAIPQPDPGGIFGNGAGVDASQLFDPNALALANLADLLRNNNDDNNRNINSKSGGGSQTLPPNFPPIGGAGAPPSKGPGQPLPVPPPPELAQLAGLPPFPMVGEIPLSPELVQRLLPGGQGGPGAPSSYGNRADSMIQGINAMAAAQMNLMAGRYNQQMQEVMMGRPQPGVLNALAVTRGPGSGLGARIAAMMSRSSRSNAGAGAPRTGRTSTKTVGRTTGTSNAAQPRSKTPQR